MPDPRPPRSAIARRKTGVLPNALCLRLAAIALIAAFLAAPRLARADEAAGVRWPSGPISEAKSMARALGGADFVALTGDQWNFLRGMFIESPDTPESLPPGNGAVMSLRPDGSASIVFVDGDLACAPMKLGRRGVEALMSVGRGEIVHAETGL